MEHPSPLDAAGRRKLLREVLLASAGATAACAVLSLLQGWVPLIRANLYALVAAIFLYVPVVLLRRRGSSTLAVGLTTRPRLRNLAFAFGAMVVVFPPFVGGFHLWQSWMFGNEPHFEAEAYRRWPADWEGRPGSHTEPPGLQLFADFSELNLRWRGLGAPPLRLDLETDGRLELLRTAGPVRPRIRTGGRLQIDSAHPGALRLRVHGGERLRVDARQGERPLAPDEVHLGAGGAHPEAVPIDAERSTSWIWLMVLSHLLLVALPEELFYRGYVQTTLDAVWPRKWRILGVEIGMSVLVTSVLFALGHYLVDFRVQRLAVFFPSLLFGWLRAGSRSLAAPVLVHAASNVLSDLLTKGYVL